MFKSLLKVIVLFFTFTRLFYCTNKKKSRRMPYVELLIKVFRNKFAIRKGVNLYDIHGICDFS